MKYTETFKKSQTKVGTYGSEMSIDCERIESVVNENGDLMKYMFIDGVVTVESDDFKLLTVTYSSK